MKRIKIENIYFLFAQDYKSISFDYRMLICSTKKVQDLSSLTILTMQRLWQQRSTCVNEYPYSQDLDNRSSVRQISVGWQAPRSSEHCPACPSLLWPHLQSHLAPQFCAFFVLCFFKIFCVFLVVVVQLLRHLGVRLLIRKTSILMRVREKKISVRSILLVINP